MTVPRRRILLSAYACEPGRGSEPGLGWAAARRLAEDHEVWVITRANNAAVIEAALADDPVPLHPVYYDLPRWARFWKHGPRGVQAYYYLWQRGIRSVARRLHAEHQFHLIHHITFAKCWAPSFLADLGVPFVWGPLGGGDSTPAGFRGDFPLSGRIRDTARNTARWLAGRTPALRRTARRSAVALGTTPGTVVYLRSLGARDVRPMMQAALPGSELRKLLDRPAGRDDGPPRFVCAGSLLSLKGFHLAVEAFGRAGVPDARLEIFGQGPEFDHLRSLVGRYRLDDRVRMHGQVPREELLDRLSGSRALLHPALHDSAPWICAEAMALAVPVVCLDLTGPAVMVPDEAGIRIRATETESAIQGLADAIRRLASDPALRHSLGQRARERAGRAFSWEVRGREFEQLYSELLDSGEGLP